MIMQILWAIIIALVMAFLIKRVPILEKISDWVVTAFLLGLFFALPKIGIAQITDWVNMIPYLQYILAIPGGLMIGKMVSKYLPF
jgi:hypothetical protein